jgi:hypothetical protein
MSANVSSLHTPGDPMEAALLRALEQVRAGNVILLTVIATTRDGQVVRAHIDADVFTENERSNADALGGLILESIGITPKTTRH